MTTLLYEDLGHIEYQAAIALQEKLVVLRQQELVSDTLLFVEHPHVYTLGRGGKEANVLAPKDVPVSRAMRTSSSHGFPSRKLSLRSAAARRDFSKTSRKFSRSVR